MLRSKHALTVALVAAFFSASLYTASMAFAEELPSAQELLERGAKNRSTGNSIQTVKLVEDRKGGHTEKTLTSTIKEVGDGLSNTHLVFESGDLEGTTFVTRAVKGGADIQFTWMPALEQLTYVEGGGKARKGKFFGTDFSYEDLEVGDPDEATHKTLAKETIDVDGQKVSAWKVESVPKPGLDGSYTKIQTWVDSSNDMPRRVDFFTKKGGDEPVKRMTLLKLEKKGDRLVPMVTRMETLGKDSRTDIVIESIRMDVPAEEIPDAMFTEEWVKNQAG